MKKIAFLGGGKIGRTMIAHVTEGKKAEVAFVYDPFVKDTDICGVKVVSDITEDMFEGLDLVIECATAEVVAANIVTALKHCDFMPFSMTAFRDDELREKALKDRNIWQELMDTRKAEQPLAAFCAKCRELGYQIYEMDLITAGEEFYATMRRSTNGGGENSPKLAGEDDFYELFFASLEEHI